MNQSQQLALSIDGNAITQDENGLYSINDLFKSSGGEDKHSPRRWQQLVRTKSLISELKSESDNDGNPVIKSDKKAGTFVCTELVYAYAMAISPKFELKVIRGFHSAALKEHRLAKMKGEGIWNQNRALGKLERRDITDAIKLFVSYAQAQGSRGAHFYYVNITKLVNKALCIDDRDEIGEDKLALLATAEIIAEIVLIDGMRQQLPYKTIYEHLKQQMESFAEMVIDLKREVRHREPSNPFGTRQGGAS